jgi:hypothetical protein
MMHSTGEDMTDPHPSPGHVHGPLETCIDCGGPMFMCRTLETGFHLSGWEGCQLFRTIASHDVDSTHSPSRSIDQLSPEQLEMRVGALRALESQPKVALHYHLTTGRTRAAAALLAMSACVAVLLIAASIRNGPASWVFVIVAALHAAIAMSSAFRMPKTSSSGEVEIDLAVFGAASPIPFVVSALFLFVVTPLGFSSLRYDLRWLATGVALVILLFGFTRLLAPNIRAREETS